VSIDYALLFVTRWREERARGLSNEDAVVATMTTAGRAVLLSGLTVGISLIALFGRWNWWLPHPLARLLRVPQGSPIADPGGA
jgi:uncharacterized membrane protein YdfJ with MMPL/SSD domain